MVAGLHICGKDMRLLQAVLLVRSECRYLVALPPFKSRKTHFQHVARWTNASD